MKDASVFNASYYKDLHGNGLNILSGVIVGQFINELMQHIVDSLSCLIFLTWWTILKATDCLS